MIPNKSTTIITSRRVRTPGPTRVNTRAAVESLLTQLAKGMSAVPTSVVVKETTNRTAKPSRRRQKKMVRRYAVPRTFAPSSSGSMSRAREFVHQLLDPFKQTSLVRYPDGTMMPTAVTGSTYRSTYTTTGSGLDANGQVFAIAPVMTANNLIGGATTFGYTPANCFYDGSQTNSADYFYPIMTPGGSIAASVVASNGSFTGRNVTFPNAQTLGALMGSQRTLSLGMRIEINGLPGSTFLVPGRAYFIQQPASSWHSQFGSPGTTLPLGGGAPAAGPTNGVLAWPSESDLSSLVASGRGFAVDLEDIRRNGGITLVWKPTSPLDFAFRQSPLQMLMDRTFDGLLFSSIGASPPITAVADPISGDSSELTNPEILVGYFIGSPSSGLTYTVTYGSITEYLPNVTSSGVVSTEVPTVDRTASDAILNSAGEIARESGGKFSIRDIPEYLGGMVRSPLGRAVIAGAKQTVRFLTDAGLPGGFPRAGAGGPLMLTDYV